MILAKKLKELDINLTEEQVLVAIKRVLSTFSHDMKFPMYDEDDLYQECVIITIKQIDKFKKSKQSNKKDLFHSMESWLYVVLLNRIKNLKRDKFCRNDPPCMSCYKNSPCLDGDYCDDFVEWKKRNDSKMSVYNPWSLEAEGDETQHDVECPTSEKFFNGVDLKDVISLLRKKLSEEHLENFELVCSGQKIKHSKKAQLLNKIHEILNNGEE